MSTRTQMDFKEPFYEAFARKNELTKLDLITLHLIDRDLLNEVKSIIDSGDVALYFGKTLRDIKCVIRDETGLKHEIFVKYKAPKKLVISSVNLPYSLLQDREYNSLEDILIAYKGYLNDLLSYFYELQKIDSLCTVMEPTNPTFKDNYRRVLLDDRIWLHVEVTPEGLATNIHLVGNSERWHYKLQSGLLSWDHDKDIVDNIMTVFDLTELSPASHKSLSKKAVEKQIMVVPTCAICLCTELQGYAGVPQPLCQNSTCGVYYHRNCLYQWLVECSGNRPPAFGVATGACPTCLQPIVCNEKDT